MEGIWMSSKVLLAESEGDYNKLGIQRETAIWEDGMRTHGGEGTYEWWYFDAEYMDGTKVVVVFYTKNGFDVKGPACPTVQINITLPDGRSLTNFVSEKRDTPIRASKTQCDVTIANSSVSYSEGKYVLHFTDGSVDYRCTMTSIIPMWRPKTGHWLFGDQGEKFFAWFVAQPSADLQAVLSIDGETRELTGNGYHDHNWGNIEMNRLMNHWYWCRANIGPYTVISCDIISEKEYDYTRLPVMMIAKEGVILDDKEENTIVERLDTEYHPVTKKFIDNKLTFIQNSDHQTSYRIEYKREHDLVASSLLDNMGISAPKKLAAKVMRLNPTYIRCIGTVTLTVEDNGQQTVFEREGLWEQMFFGNNKDAIIHSRGQI
jgi:hypothetical protein